MILSGTWYNLHLQSFVWFYEASNLKQSKLTSFLKVHKIYKYFFDNNYLLRNHDNGRVACATAVTQLSFVVLTCYGYITLIFWSPCTRVETWCVLFNFALLIFFTRVVVTLAEEVSRIVNNEIVTKCLMLEGFLFTRFKNVRKNHFGKFTIFI